MTPETQPHSPNKPGADDRRTMRIRTATGAILGVASIGCVAHAYRVFAVFAYSGYVGTGHPPRESDIYAFGGLGLVLALVATWLIWTGRGTDARAECDKPNRKVRKSRNSGRSKHALMKTKMAIVVLAIGLCLVLLAIYHSRWHRPDKWSWDLVRNGEVYSYSQHKWVRYPLGVQGDGWAVKESLDAFHQQHGLPPIAWVDEPPEVPTGPNGKNPVERQQSSTRSNSQSSVRLTTRSASLDTAMIASWGTQRDYFASLDLDIISWEKAKNVLLDRKVVGGKQYHSGWLTLFEAGGNKFLVKQPEMDAVFAFAKAHSLKLDTLASE